jgi:hypothetical protein
MKLEENSSDAVQQLAWLVRSWNRQEEYQNSAESVKLLGLLKVRANILLESLWYSPQEHFSRMGEGGQGADGGITSVMRKFTVLRYCAVIPLAGGVYMLPVGFEGVNKPADAVIVTMDRDNYPLLAPAALTLILFSTIALVYATGDPSQTVAGRKSRAVRTTQKGTTQKGSTAVRPSAAGPPVRVKVLAPQDAPTDIPGVVGTA